MELTREHFRATIFVGPFDCVQNPLLEEPLSSRCLIGFKTFNEEDHQL